jgi:hypothetical protein
LRQIAHRCGIAMNPLALPRRFPWLLLVSAALVVPFVLLAFYAQPQSDDFVCGEVATRDGVLAETWHFYQTWTGRYSACAALAWFGLDLDHGVVAAPLVLMAAWWLSCWRFLFVAGNAWLRRVAQPRRLALLPAGGVALALLAFYITRMPSPCQGFYWLGGAMTYMPAGVLSWLLLAELVRLLDPLVTGRRLLWHTLTAMVLVVTMIGFNETAMFLWDLALALGVAVAALARWRPGWLAAVLASAAVATAVVMAAPGNGVRTQAQSEGRHQLVRSAGKSLLHTATKVGLWSLDPALWVASLLLLPALRRGPAPAWKWLCHRWACPAVIAATVLVLTLGAFPAYWAMGSGPPLRSCNLLYALFAAGWLAAVGTAALAYPRWAERWSRLHGSWRLVLMLALFAVGNWPRATWDLCLLAPEFQRESVARALRVQDAVAHGQRKLKLDPLHSRPKTIYFEDLSPDPANGGNVFYARRLGLETVWVRGSADHICVKCKRRG